MPIVARMDPEGAHRAAVYIASKGLAPRNRGRDPPILVGMMHCDVSVFTGKYSGHT